MSRQALTKSPNHTGQSKTARSKPLKNDMPAVEKSQLSNMWVLPFVAGKTDDDCECNLPISHQKPVMRQIQQLHGNQAAQWMIQLAAKEAALKKWQEEHCFDTHIRMGYNYRQLSRVLDASVISR